MLSPQINKASKINFLFSMLRISDFTHICKPYLLIIIHIFTISKPYFENLCRKIVWVGKIPLSDETAHCLKLKNFQANKSTRKTFVQDRDWSL